MPEYEPSAEITSKARRVLSHGEVVESWDTRINEIVKPLAAAISLLEKATHEVCKDWVKLLQKRKGYLEMDEKELKALWLEFKGYEHARKTPIEVQGMDLSWLGNISSLLLRQGPQCA